MHTGLGSPPAVDASASHGDEPRQERPPRGVLDSLDLAGAANRFAETEKDGRLISSLSTNKTLVRPSDSYLSPSVC
jgi:hypothetical protein